jgi:class 3 adenylate cyclase/predicted ATPase
MNPVWLSFVPRYVAEDIFQHLDQSPVGREQHYDIVALFADVSGFTAMSEALGKTGKSGAEELTAILNSYFEPMIDLVTSYGGVIGKFGGDAMTVLFIYTPETQRETVQRAAQCALEMQAGMTRYEAIRTSQGTFGLAMKVGLALGPVLCTTVGDPCIRLEYLIAGEVLDRCADAEHHASKGEVVAHDDLLPMIPDVEIVERREGFTCISGKAGERASVPLPIWDARDLIAAQATLAAYLHPVIAQRLRLGQSSFINEHRKVTVLFISFSGFDYDHDPGVAAKLQTYLDAAIQIIDRYDGYLNKVDMGDKGSKAIVLFGAPVAHENDEERALRCALEIISLPGATARIGVNTGFVFAGQVGSRVRQEYTVMGDVVNLSARLMQASQPGQALVNQATYQAARDAFRWQALEPIRVKGKTEPIPIYALESVNDRHSNFVDKVLYALPMVGRQNELALANDRIDLTLMGRGQIIAVTAEAGLGKTRLNMEIARAAMNRKLAVYGSECHSYGTNISYLVWHGIWRDFFGVEAGAPAAVQIAQLEAALTEIDPTFAARLPLLGVALNLPIPDNDLTAPLDAALRTELLKSLLLDCVQHRALTTPMLLVLEDAHWIDALSEDLLEFIGRNIEDLSVMISIVHRPIDDHSAHLDWAARLPHYTAIPLADFTPDEAGQLIRMKLNQLFGESSDMPRPLLEHITQKAQGNPFYVEEFINLIRDRDIDPHDVAALAALDLPDSLHSLIMSRIDQLKEREKVTLKVSSVIGRLFRLSWVTGTYPPAGTMDEVRGHLSTLSRLDITPIDRVLPEPEYLFKHITTQEAAYDSLAFALRETLHEGVAHYIEGTYPAALEEYVEMLAYHYGRTRDQDKQRHYFRRAGLRAKNAYANQAAIDYYERLVPLITEGEKADVYAELGQISQLTGDWTRAETLYRDSLRLAIEYDDRLSQARAHNALGNLLIYVQSYDEARQQIEAARAIYEQIADQRGICRTLEYLGFLNQEQTRYPEAEALAEQQLAIATAIGDPLEICKANRIKGTANLYLGNTDQALACYTRQLDIADAIGNRQEVIYAYANMVGVYLAQGDYARAMDCTRRALSAADEIGYLHVAGVIIGNAVEIYREQGDYDNALNAAWRSLEICGELNDFMGLAPVLAHIGMTFASLKQRAVVDDVFRRVIALDRAHDAPYFLSSSLHNYAHIMAEEGDYDRAQTLNNEAIPLAESAGNAPIHFSALALAIRLRALKGEIDTAAALTELDVLRRDWAEAKEQGAIAYESWRLVPSREDQKQAAIAAYESLYAASANLETRARLIELTGRDLPPLPQFSPLAGVPPRPSDDLYEVFARVDRYLAQQAAEAQTAAES